MEDSPDGTTWVVVAFADRTLGGVSRSALSAGRIWRELGMSVLFVALLPVHPERRSRFDQIGVVVEDVAQAPWATAALVHLHHGAMSSATRENIAKLMDAVRQARSTPLPLMTKNVFAVDDRVLDDWPGPRATTTPGRWAAMQYAYNTGHGLASRNAWLIPNVQDAEFFRLPSPAERQEARSSLGIADEHCILRIGSPLMGKWSRSYVSLAEKVRSVGDAKLVLVGVPPELREAIGESRSVVYVEPTADDVFLRDMYWAADVFALDAARGETFGNVAFESLLCGVPVVYRARPFRDNTPWELVEVSGFGYAATDRAWLGMILDRDRARKVDRETIVRRYSYDVVPQMYRAVAAGLASARAGLVQSPDTSWHSQLRLGDRLACASMHNPMSMKLKELRLR